MSVAIENNDKTDIKTQVASRSESSSDSQTSETSTDFSSDSSENESLKPKKIGRENLKKHVCFYTEEFKKLDTLKSHQVITHIFFWKKTSNLPCIIILAKAVDQKVAVLPIAY
jgi:hypothetical protein